GHVRGFVRGGNDAGHRRMRQHVLKEEMSPGRAADVLCPRRQGFARDALKYCAVFEWPIDHHRDTQLLREWEQTLFRVARLDRIVELHPVPLVRAQHGLELLVSAGL